MQCCLRGTGPVGVAAASSSDGGSSRSNTTTANSNNNITITTISNNNNTGSSNNADSSRGGGDAAAALRTSPAPVAAGGRRTAHRCGAPQLLARARQPGCRAAEGGRHAPPLARRAVRRPGVRRAAGPGFVLRDGGHGPHRADPRPLGPWHRGGRRAATAKVRSPLWPPQQMAIRPIRSFRVQLPSSTEAPAQIFVSTHGVVPQRSGIA